VCKNLHSSNMDARPSRKRAASAAAKPAKKMRRSVSMRSPQETGYVDLASATYANDTTGTITLIATIPQGTSVNQRVGKKVIIKSVQFRGYSRVGSTGTTADGTNLVVYDRRPTGSLPAISDILDSASSASFNNDANSGRFQILKRVDWVLTGNSATPATGNEILNADFYLKVGKPSVFKAAGTGAIADISDGALYFVSVGNIAAGTNAPFTLGGFRTRFIDV